MDLFIEQNFLMNLIVLSLTQIFCDSVGPKHYIRRIISAISGTLASTAILLCLNYVAFVIFTALLIVPLMIVIAFGRQNLRQLLQKILLSWLSIVILNGVASAFFQMTGIQSLTFYVGVIVLLIARVLVQTLLKSLHRQEYRMLVSLYHQGKHASCVGLYDSGNRLKMPDSGEPVHIISCTMREQLGTEQQTEKTIPFRALGTESGTISVIQIEKMCIQTGDKSLCCENVWLGYAGEELLKNTDYQMILNSAVRLS